MGKHSKKLKPAAKGGATAERLKQAYTATQIKLMQRDLNPVDFQFTFSTLEGIREYNEHLAHLVLQRQLDGRDHGSLQNGIRNATTALIGPSSVNVNVTQNIDMAALQRKVDEMKPDDESVVIEAINRLSAAPSSQTT